MAECMSSAASMTHVGLDTAYSDLLRQARFEQRLPTKLQHSQPEGIANREPSALSRVAELVATDVLVPASRVETSVMGGKVLPSRCSVWDKAAVATAFQEASVKPSHLTNLYK